MFRCLRGERGGQEGERGGQVFNLDIGLRKREILINVKKQDLSPYSTIFAA